MEEKQLNLNQPLLSLRRGSGSPEVNKSSPYLPPLPYYRSELKSGPVRNPGAVPFRWEHTPGKPKNGSQEPGQMLISPLPLAPKLPPGRVASHKHKSIDETPTNSPGYSSWPHTQNKALWPDDQHETEKEDDEATSSSEENNSETYLDARDALSRTGSSLNCSLTGVSGLDAGPSNKTLLDPQMQHLMMARFLPAAQAVASEAPQYASKKQPVAKNEQPKPMKKVVVNNKRSTVYYDAHFVSLHGNNEDEYEDEEDEGGKYQGHEDLSAKLCGLLPRFCLLNPIPGIRDHAQIVPQVPSLRTKPLHSVPSIKVKNKQRLMNLGDDAKRINWKNVQTNRSSLNGHNFSQKTIASLGLPGDSRVKVDVNKKQFTRLKEFLEDNGSVEEEITGSPIKSIKERTLYIDSGQNVDPRNSNSSSSESTRGRAGRTPSVDYALQDFLLCHCEENEEPKDLQRDDSGLLLPSPKIKQHNQDLSLVAHVQQTDVKEEKSKSSPPPTIMLSTLLPKSPSESWLSRTLPSMPSKNPNLKTYLRSPAWDPNRGRVLTSSNVELAPIMEN